MLLSPKKKLSSDQNRKQFSRRAEDEESIADYNEGGSALSWIWLKEHERDCSRSIKVL